MRQTATAGQSPQPRPGAAPVVRPKNALQITLGNVATTFRSLRRNRAGFIGFLLVMAIIVLCFIGPFFIPLDPSSHVDRIYEPPSWHLPLGTDYSGRSVWPQVVHGGAQALEVAFVAATISTLISIVLGALSAYSGGRLDAFIVAAADIFLTLPTFIILAVIAATFRPRNIFLLALILGLLTWPGLLRAVRAQVLSIKERDYIEAARCLGLRRTHIVMNEILPNMAGYIIISFIFSVTATMLLQVNLVAFGLVPITGDNWAIQIYQAAYQKGALYNPDSSGYIMGPITAIILFQFGLVTMTRSLEEIFNPRLRGNL